MNDTDWRGHYRRDSKEWYKKFSTGVEAYNFLKRGMVEGSLTPLGILRPDGVEFLPVRLGGTTELWYDLPKGAASVRSVNSANTIHESTEAKLLGSEEGLTS